MLNFKLNILTLISELKLQIFEILFNFHSLILYMLKI